MQIKSKEYKKWKFLSEHGDYAEISKLLPSPDYRKISNAFKNRECSEEVYEAIRKFYSLREKRVTSEQDQD